VRVVSRRGTVERSVRVPAGGRAVVDTRRP
jgi:hypothetical protein